MRFGVCGWLVPGGVSGGGCGAGGWGFGCFWFSCACSACRFRCLPVVGGGVLGLLVENCIVDASILKRSNF